MQEIWLGPIQDIQGRPNLKDNSLRPCLFVLREDKTLNRYDVDTGHLLESVFLSSTRKYAELRLNYSGSQPNVCVKSTKQIEFCKSNDCTHRNCKQTCISLIMFSYPPLTFLCNFEVTQKIFGSSTTTVSENVKKTMQISRKLLHCIGLKSTFIELILQPQLHAFSFLGNCAKSNL